MDYDRNLPEKCYIDAAQLFGETESVRNDSIAVIREYLREHSEINGQEDARMIVYFLRSCKFDIAKTKKKIKCFYRMRSERPEWFSQRDPLLPEIETLLRIGCFLPLPIKDEENRLIVVIRTSAHNPRKQSQNDVFKCCKMLLDLVLHLDETVSIYGISVIFDMVNVTLGHALQLNPPLIRRSVQSWENYCCSPKMLDFVNAPIHVNVILNIFRSFMSVKMKSRVHVTKAGPSISRHLLPPELGGTLTDTYATLTQYWYDKAVEFRTWFIENERYRSVI